MKISATIISGLVAVLIIFTLIAGCLSDSGTGNQSTKVPVARFTSYVTNLDAPQEFHITDQSSHGPDAWIWSFRDISGNNSEIL